MSKNHSRQPVASFAPIRHPDKLRRIPDSIATTPDWCNLEADYPPPTEEAVRRAKAAFARFGIGV